MAAKLVDWSLRNRFLVIVLAVLLVAAGGAAMQQLPIDAVPDVTNVQVQVLTKAPALAPLEIEQLITFQVETAMAGLPDIEEIRSVSKFGLSAVTVVFNEGTDIYRARQLVQDLGLGRFHAGAFPGGQNDGGARRSGWIGRCHGSALNR